MIINKLQKDKGRFVFDWSYFNSGREGFKQVLQIPKLKGKKILVPAYIGESSREGSGVFDPVRETKTPYVFYHLDNQLNISLDDLKIKIKNNRDNILLIIHYFGFINSTLNDIKQYARQYGMFIIEDFAHAFYTFWLKPVIDFDYGVFSIHKLFPEDSGGMVLGKEKVESGISDGASKYNLFNYDIQGITQKRIENYEFVFNALKEGKELKDIVILKEDLNGVVPQTFPILLPTRALRDKLYFQMNDDGFGVVSLYHTLIDEIDYSFTVEQEISDRILNLPVHQDIEQVDLKNMVDQLYATIREYKQNKI